MKYFLIYLNIIISLIIITQTKSIAQVYYDDWPTTRETNDRSSETNIREGDFSTNFVPIGTQWNESIITYFFQNGTGDIAGDNEQQAIRDGFDIWSNETNLAFLEVCNAADADIVILWGTFAHGDPNPPCVFGACDFDGANGVLAHVLGGPPPNDFGNFAGDMHFDDSELWTLAARFVPAQPIDLVTVAAHEIGHSLGLDHTTVAGSLMEAIYDGSQRALGQDDINGIRSIYGNPTANGVIAGDFPVCTGGSGTTYSITIPPGVTSMTWNRSSNLQYVSGQGTANYTVRSTGTIGLGWVEVTLTTACGTSTTIRRDVQSSAFSAGQISVSGTAAVCPGNAYNYTATVPDGHKSNYTYSWTYPSGWSVFSQYQNTIRLYAPTNNTQYGTVRVSVNNTCGSSAPSGITVFPGYSCSSFITLENFIIYPNPSDEYLIIEPIKEEESEISKMEDSTYSIKLYNKNQELLFEENANKKEKIQLNTSKLVKGIYIIHINDNGTLLMEKVLIE